MIALILSQNLISMSNKKQPGIQKKITFYNMIPNLIWSVIFLTPITVFCFSNMNVKWILIFFIISFLTIFLPRSFFNIFQLGTNSSVYKKTGVIFINKFTQNGDIINRIIRKKYPGYKLVSKKNSSIKKLFNQTYMFEKFHFLMFSFFLLISFFAVFIHLYGWAIFIIITNLIYNVYPILLQQYIRLRIETISRKKFRT